MTSDEIRKENARNLAALIGGIAAFAKKMDMSDSQASQLIGENPSRNIGPKIARRIETKFNKQNGWLDKNHKSEANDLDEEALKVARDWASLPEEYRKKYAEKIHKLAEGFRCPEPEDKIAEKTSNVTSYISPVTYASVESISDAEKRIKATNEFSPTQPPTPAQLKRMSRIPGANDVKGMEKGRENKRNSPHKKK